MPTLAPPPSAGPSIDLDAYLRRIGLCERPEPSLAFLKRLHRLHESTIPFENLDVLLGREISIELPAIQRKLVEQGRGGYCFEQNSLFAAALRAIGFTVTPMLARVLWMQPTQAVPPLSHMILRVETERGPQLADVGFGGVGLVEPISLSSTSVQHQAFEPRRLLKSGSDLSHQIQLGERWQDIYRFTPIEAAPIDLEVGNWFSFTHPKARFRNSLLVARLAETGRIIISNNELIQRSWDGEVSRETLRSEEGRLDALGQLFGLTFPEETRFGLLDP
ncbi:arylamine N-acetyltransferase [Pelagicoccus sp. SDUM812003]|uniref:arylamine N-acetyltransferase family protein n=1 Tax=Pelagicoccus sp. SDUM812003 TaxID=3041267 RepID=UPI00280CA3C0|nr:arylamine N-acetyltransferase [Pelagicoccus sp. SDUM812003]MDQ8203583.1 arylamine N-acetyltransferase [Pelagicoccus sp. SDUM812003]